MGNVARCALALVVMTIGALAVDCASDRSRSDFENDDDRTGRLGIELDIAPGVRLDTSQYTITGPGGYNASGSIDVSMSTQLSVVVGGLPAGNGYVAISS
jgi:hypothetical protein